MVKVILLAYGKVDSDMKLNEMLLDVREANANRDIYILNRFSSVGLFIGQVSLVHREN